VIECSFALTLLAVRTRHPLPLRQSASCTVGGREPPPRRPGHLRGGMRNDCGKPDPLHPAGIPLRAIRPPTRRKTEEKRAVV